MRRRRKSPKGVRAFLSFWAAASIAVPFSCGGKQADVGAQNDKALRRFDGKPSGDGQTCSMEGTDYFGDSRFSEDTQRHAIGETWPSPDGCNQCTCITAGVECEKDKIRSGSKCITLTGTSCIADGIAHGIGEEFPCPDGCNTCTCLEKGILSTLIACPGR